MIHIHLSRACICFSYLDPCAFYTSAFFLLWTVHEIDDICISFEIAYAPGTRFFTVTSSVLIFHEDAYALMADGIDRHVSLLRLHVFLTRGFVR